MQILLRLMALVAVCAPLLSAARPLPLRQDEELVYSLQSQPLAEFLQVFFADAGLDFQPSDALRGDSRTLNGIRAGTAQEIVTSITSTTGVLLYYDGAAVHGYLAEERENTHIAVGSEQVPQLRRALRDVQLDDPYNSYRLYDSSGLLEISGAPRFVDEVIRFADSMVGQLTVEEDLRMVSLKHAWASDHQYRVGTSLVTVPGIATLLQATFTGESATPDTAARSSTPPRRPRLLNPEPEPASETAPAADSAPKGAVRVVANPYQNAVILRGPRNQLDRYERLINALDTPVQLVEIEATIIDVDTSKVRRLGVDWYGFGEELQGSFIGGGSVGERNAVVSALLGEPVSALTAVPGLSIGTIVNDDYFFSARLNALEQEGALKVVSRPKVATINDLEASIESSETQFVPVSGAYDAELFEVFAGTVLRVTPHVIQDRERDKIRLLVSIQDGALDRNATSTSPRISTNLINTQAVVTMGSSLLLGGLVREVTGQDENRVPLLGRIPLLGSLFRNRVNQVERRERLFLISPRIVQPDGATAGDGGRSNVIESNVSRTCKPPCRGRYESHNINAF